MTRDEIIQSATLMDLSQTASPLASLPASGPRFSEASGFMGISGAGDGLWDEYYNYEQTGYDYENYAGYETVVDGRTYVRPGIAVTAETTASERGDPRRPAPISVIPTSTTNPERPRTVAAGYDGERGVLTVVFRDGTFYNYYTVSEDDWTAFKSQASKGVYIRTFLDGKPRGTARMANASLAAREGLYRIARTGQWINDGQLSAQFDYSMPPRLNPTKSRSRSRKK